ncbi:MULTISPECIES: flagellar hook-basal body complex protein FliE [Cohnella]|jgi:flagellar hook-basal body complex protein FliE|uniref:flagellar hook-basal body complex protein FliE n=1 Tax=Cohnella TaxID=329857 RepID=UPI00036E3EF1|nr:MULTISPECIES: flagellar hook-basal body complex protein FliE [Cohnella]REK67241.1 MAG: flagellar hook-basal body complex protein FliE [Cohnella sp.]
MIENHLVSSVGQTVSGMAAASKKTTPAEATESFASFLKTALDSVAAQENNVHKVNEAFIIGEADVNDVMIAASKASLSLELTAQIRNKVIDAYQEIMRMSV